MEEYSASQKILDSEQKYYNIKKTNKISQRYYIFDNFKGFLIFTVVFGHFLFNYSIKNKDSFINKLVNYIYTFHMPAFIFCSGFLSKSPNSQKLGSIIKLLLIYLVFNFFHAYILYIYKGIRINFLEPYNSYWYILSLINWRMSIKFISNQFFPIIMSFIISFIVGFSNDINNIP